MFAVCFAAMASPCEILLETRDEREARELGRAAAREAWRIEAKFSRDRPESVVNAINRSNGQTLAVDEETAALIDFAAQCHALSAGRFDITSGVLHRSSSFDGSDGPPHPAALAALLPLIGLGKLRWECPRISLPAGMEIDFGGFAREYAVDSVLALLAAHFAGAALVDFGGDLAANHAPQAGPWPIGVGRPQVRREPRLLLEVSGGGVVTRNDNEPVRPRDGARSSHILDARTGRPVPQVPRSLTVAASCCLEAGMLATFAMLEGSACESFLAAQGVRYWSLR
jgi:thiamine biosynthesis lipoprotein